MCRGVDAGHSTHHKIDIPRNARQRTFGKAFDAAADVSGTFANSSWGKKVERKRKRAAMNDFDRFKLMIAKKQKARAVNNTLKKLRK